MRKAEWLRQYLYWKIEDRDVDVYESVTLGRNILSIDVECNEAKLYWLSVENNHREHRPAPDHLVEATQAWLDGYRGIPFDDFMRKMFE